MIGLALLHQHILAANCMHHVFAKLHYFDRKLRRFSQLGMQQYLYQDKHCRSMLQRSFSVCADLATLGAKSVPARLNLITSDDEEWEARTMMPGDT